MSGGTESAVYPGFQRVVLFWFFAFWFSSSEGGGGGQRARAPDLLVILTLVAHPLTRPLFRGLYRQTCPATGTRGDCSLFVHPTICCCETQHPLPALTGGGGRRRGGTENKTTLPENFSSSSSSLSKQTPRGRARARPRTALSRPTPAIVTPSQRDRRRRIPSDISNVSRNSLFPQTPRKRATRASNARDRLFARAIATALGLSRARGYKT